VHGYSQAWQSWSRQLNDPKLASRLHLVAFDLRGHGDSDKPLEKDAYHDARRWADDLKSVIEAARTPKPVIVAWSYGGRVINDYLSNYGDSAISGVVYVAATSTGDRSGLGRSFGTIRGMLDDDPAAASKGTETFLRACFERQPDDVEFAAMKAFNDKTPVAVRKLLGGRAAAYDPALKALRVPVWIVHGAQDQISAPAMSQYTKSQVPQAVLSVYEGAGHSTFYEFSERFNTELLAFVDRTRA
jgi:non-heme chloroperoxidase